jgi:hypothetical protein
MGQNKIMVYRSGNVPDKMEMVWSYTEKTQRNLTKQVLSPGTLKRTGNLGNLEITWRRRELELGEEEKKDWKVLEKTHLDKAASRGMDANLCLPRLRGVWMQTYASLGLGVYGFKPM